MLGVELVTMETRRILNTKVPPRIASHLSHIASRCLSLSLILSHYLSLPLLTSFCLSLSLIALCLTSCVSGVPHFELPEFDIDEKNPIEVVQVEMAAVQQF